MKRIAIKAFAMLVVAAATTAKAQQIEIEPVEIFGGGARVINPVICDSVLYFASDKKNDIVVNYFDDNENHLFRIYKMDIRHKRPDGHPTPYLDKNNKPYNQTALTFDSQKRPVMTQNNPSELTNRGELPMGIFTYSSPKQKTGGVPFDVSQPRKTNNAYPSFSADGKMMIFASDREGGIGGSDLYVCYKQSDGFWSEPKNMGPDINTIGTETTPFIHSSGKIFFASNGRDDSKKLDIYYTFQTETGFAKPVRFDIVVNSIEDDYGFYYSDNEEWGYVTSNRHGTDKLYFFSQQFPHFPECDEMVIENYCFEFYESSTENYDTTMFDFKWEMSDGYKAAGVEADHCFDGPGVYDIALSVTDKTSGEELFKIAEYQMVLVRPVQLNIIYPKTIKVGERVNFDVDPSYITDFTPTTYYWDFGHGLRIKGKNASVVFEKSGKYFVKCGTIADEDPSMSLCTWVEIFVEEADKQNRKSKNKHTN